jgi:hypothetical protein
MDGIPADRFKEHAAQIASDQIGQIAQIVEEFVAGSVQVF